MSELLAKLTPPRIHNIYERTQLFEQLDEARCNTKVNWISAPAGSGKTTLIASYLKARKIKPLWYQVDEGDSDIASFFYYMGQLGNVLKQKKDPLRILTPEYLHGLPTFTRNFFRELFTRMKSPGVLVLDNFQDAGKESQLAEMLSVALNEVPTGITIMVISRQDPPPVLARVQISQGMSIFNWEDIRLQLDESIAIGKLHSGRKKVSDETYAKIHEQTQGWTAGLVLYADSADDVLLPESIKGTTNQQTIFNYFASELFEHTNGDEQEFLLKTALFPEIDAINAVKLTGESKAKEILDVHCKQNFFIYRCAKARPTYSYHPLFREFLRNRAKQYYSEIKLAEYKLQAAELLEAQGQYGEAAVLYIDIADWKKLTTLLTQRAQEILEQGKWKTLQRWITSIPEEIVENEAWLLFWQASSKVPVTLVGARDDFANAYHKFMKCNDVAGAYLSWAGAVDTFFYIWNEFSLLDYWINEFKNLREKFPKIPSLDIEARVVYTIFGALIWRQPDKPEIRKWCSRAEGMLEKAIEPSLKLLTGSLVAQYYLWWRGNLIKIRSFKNILDATSKQVNASTLSQLMWKVMEGSYLLLNNEVEKSQKTLSDGLLLASETGVYHTNFLLYSQIILASLTGFDTKRAKEILEQMESNLHDAESFDYSHYAYLYSWYALAEGDLKGGVSEKLYKAERIGGSNYQIFGKLTLAMALVQYGDLLRAEALMEKVRIWGQDVDNDYIEVQYQMLKAYIALYRNEYKSSLEPLNEALVLAKQKDYVAIPWIGFLPDVLTKLYTQALINNIETDYVCMLIRKRNLRPSVDQIIPDKWPFPIKIYTLGRFNLLIDDEPISAGRKAPKKMLELLKAIVAFGGKDVSNEKLTQLLWPNLEGDAGYNTFTTTLHRLRKYLGHDAILYSDGRVKLDPKVCWVDIWNIERQLNGILALEKKDLDEQGLQILNKVLKHYQGPFLYSEEETSFSLSMRERLHQKLISAINKVGQQLEQDLQHAEALLLYQRVLDIDDVHEGFYKGIMRCCIILGKPSDGMSAYQRCRTTLHKKLGVSPSSETEQIRNQLQS